MMIDLSPSRRRGLRARAHGLQPVASIGRNGPSEAVLAEIDRCLRAHELVKVRVYGAGRGERAAMFAEICARLQAAPVQHLGHILVLYRQEQAGDRKAARAGKRRRPSPDSRSPAQT